MNHRSQNITPSLRPVLSLASVKPSGKTEDFHFFSPDEMFDSDILLFFSSSIDNIMIKNENEENKVQRQ